MLTWLAQNTITAALLAALVAAACRLFRFRPAVAHALWLVVLVKLLTPPLVFWPWPLPNWPADPPSAQRAIADSPSTDVQRALVHEVEIVSDTLSPASSAPAVLDASPWIEIDPQGQPPTSTDFAADQPAVQPEALEAETIVKLSNPTSGLRSGTVLRWLFALWAAATLAVVALQLRRIGRLWRMARGQPPSPALRAALSQVAARLDVRPPRVVVTRLAHAPLLVALFRPKLLWPAGLERQLPPTALDGVLAHELAHLRRRDHWVGWLELAAACLWWWNPLFWYVRHRLREAAELACDAWVIHALPGGRRSYAEALIEVCRFVSRPVPPLPAVGMGNPARRSLERRLTMILRDRVPCRVPLAGLAAIALLWLAALPAWSTGQEADPQPTDPAVTPAEAPADAAPTLLPDPTPAVAPAPDDASEPVTEASPAQPATQDADRADPFAAPVADDAEPPAAPMSQAIPDVAPVPRSGRAAPSPQPDPEIADQPDSTTEPQQRLDNLEAQLEALLQEVRRLRDPGAAAPGAAPMPAPRSSSTSPVLPTRRPRAIVSGTEQAPAASPGAATASPAPTTADRPPTAASTNPFGSGQRPAQGQLRAPAQAPGAGFGQGPAATGQFGGPGSAPGQQQQGGPAPWPSRPASANVSVQTLSRATYRLPEAKAAALAQLLTEHAPDVETKVDGDTLIVTATPNAQQVIGQFIALLAGVKFAEGTEVPPQPSATR